MRELGAMTCAQLQGKKSVDVEIIASQKIPAESLGAFWNSFHLSNYDWNLKSNIKDEAKKDEDEEGDERTKRTSKLIDSFELTHETNLDSINAFRRHKALAQATMFARNIANVRANPADPDYIEL